MNGDFDPYRVLGISRQAGVEEVRQAWRRAALRFHPDSSRGESAQSDRRFIQAKEAYKLALRAALLAARAERISRQSRGVQTPYEAFDRRQAMAAAGGASSAMHGSTKGAVTPAEMAREAIAAAESAERADTTDLAKAPLADTDGRLADGSHGRRHRIPAGIRSLAPEVLLALMVSLWVGVTVLYALVIQTLWYRGDHAGEFAGPLMAWLAAGLVATCGAIICLRKAERSWRGWGALVGLLIITMMLGLAALSAVRLLATLLSLGG